MKNVIHLTNIYCARYVAALDIGDMTGPKQVFMGLGKSVVISDSNSCYRQRNKQWTVVKNMGNFLPERVRAAVRGWHWVREEFWKGKELVKKELAEKKRRRENRKRLNRKILLQIGENLHAEEEGKAVWMCGNVGGCWWTSLMTRIFSIREKKLSSSEKLRGYVDVKSLRRWMTS